MKKTREPVKPSNQWVCATCGGKPTIEHADIEKHLTDVHGITSFKGKRSMILHIDSAGHHTTQYEWAVGDLKLFQTVVSLRDRPWVRAKG